MIQKTIVIIVLALSIAGADFISISYANAERTSSNDLIFANGFETDLIFANGFEGPKAISQNLTVNEDDVLQITLTGNDANGNSDTLSYQIISTTTQGTLNGSENNWTYQANNNYHGPDQFTFTVNDGLLDSPPATVNIEVLPVNDAPIAVSASYNTSENISLDLILEASDPEEDELAYHIISNPQNGRLTGSGNQYTYTPNSFFEGEDIFSFLVNDGSNASNTATITIDVIGHGNNSPVITSEPNTQLSLINKPVGGPEFVNLSTWEINDFNYNYDPQRAGHWQFNSDFTQVTQTLNARAGALLSDFNFSNQKIDGIFSVESVRDDDFIGFVFGFQNKFQYYVFAWKQGTQDDISRGMGLWKVDLATDGSEGEPQLRDTDDEKAIRLYGNDIGWQEYTDYAFTLVHQNGEISITVTDTENHILIDSFTVYDDTFSEGRFGFYNSSQPRGTYSGFKREILAEETYYYHVQATDPDGDLLTYELMEAPDGMTIDPLTGLITWQTNTSSLGVVFISVLVTDEHGASDLQNYQLIISDNEPVIVSEPVTSVYSDFNYAYQVETYDHNPSDVISYHLLEGPAGMSVQEYSGLLTWSPVLTDIGTHNITIEVMDLEGHTAIQSYQLEVTEAPQNNAPVFQTQPELTATVGRLYSYMPVATDADGDAVSIALVNIPYDMQMFDGETITWVPTSNQVTDHEILLVATDPLGAETEQRFTISVSDVSNNQAPRIHSTPPETNVLTNTSYEYQVIASDPENDVLTYTLHTASEGMEIDHVNGLVSWLPRSDQFGNHPITVQVTDTSGAYYRQSFDLTVYERLGNNPPEINSVPSNVIDENQLYVYELMAADPDGDEISYSLITSPSGMTIDANTGRIEWPTTSTDLGLHEVIVQVSDSLNQYIRQSFGILVRTATANSAPEILSAPIFSIFAGDNYQYQIQAIDVDGDALVYQLSNSPVDMIVNNSGLIEWTPDETVIGDHEIAITVSDQRGGMSTQTYTLTVLDPSTPASNEAPVITSIPLMNAMIDTAYQYQVVANDANNDTLTYQLLNSVAGASMDANTGLFTWESSSLGPHTIEIGVSDGQVTAIQSWTVTVNEVAPLSAEIIQTPIYPIAGDDVTVTIIPVGAVGTVSLVATIHDEDLPLDQLNQGVIENATTGQHLLTIHISDDVNTETIHHTLNVYDDSVSGFEPPEVDILTPADGAIITGFNDIQVRVLDDDLTDWRLSYRYAEDDYSQRVTLAEGTDNVDDAIVAEWDTSLLRNGIYVLLIEGTDESGQRSSIAHSIFLEGDLKLGHFSIAFEDMNIPVAGIPITITRGYDSRDRNRDRAFGKGWSIGFESVRVQESRIPGLAWFMETGFYSVGPVRLPRYCVKPAGAPLISVLLPDGQVEKFKVKAKTLNPASDTLSNCQNIITPDYFGIDFIPQGDTNSTLTSNLGQNNLKIINGNLEELAFDEPINPNQYTLSMLDGTEYALDQGFNVRRIKATTGHELIFTEDGIEHSGGLSVSFIRDGMGRITRIEQADGQGVDYAYDTNGDLISFTDLNGNTTSYTYIEDHFLEDIIDPRGVRVARNEYNADGRLVAHIDANGNRIEYDNDLIAMTSTITDRRGNQTINAFDNAGNIIAQTNALGETTSYEYNHLRLETARTNHLGHRTEWAYDSQGNKLTETDPLGHVTTSTYNHKAELLTQTDALGQVTITNEYNPDYDPQRPNDAQDGYAQLKQVTDALGRTTEFHWKSGINSTTGESISVNTGYTDAARNRYDISPISGGTNDGLSGATTDLNGLRTETTYDDEARPLTETQIITDADGNTLAEYTSTYEYNANGDVIKTTDALGNITQTEYNALNKVSATIDALGRRTEMEYDDRGNQVLTRYPDGSTETMVYDEENNVIASTDRAGRTTKTTYDALNRVSAVIHPDNTPADDTDNPMTLNSYDGAGRLVAVSDALGNTTSYEYDAAGNNTQVTDAFGNITLYGYDALYRRVSMTDALGRETRYVYDVLGNLLQTILPDETSDQTDNPVLSMTYDALNRKSSDSDQAGTTTQYEYNDSGNITAVIDALGQRTEYSYDQRGNRISQTDAKGQVTAWTYDALNRVSTRTLPMGQVESFTYDAVGNQVTHTDFNGDVTTFEYDVMNQLTRKAYADGSEETYTYHTTGQIASATNSGGTTTYQYDAQDRIINETKPDGATISYGYNLNGNKTSMAISKDGINRQWQYSHDALNRLTHTTDDQNLTEVTSFNAVGLRNRLDQSNGTYTTYNYDPQNRLIGQSTFDATDTLVNSFTYTLSPTGLRTQITEQSGRISEYGYDGLYRLISENITDAVNGNHTASYNYDVVGNRTYSEVNGISTAFTYDDNDRLIQHGGITYGYDANGNMISSTEDSISTDYSYNKKNELIGTSTATDTHSFEYDPHGIRTAAIENGERTEYLIDHNQAYAQVILETSPNSEFIYTYGDDLLKQETAGQLAYFHYDGLGSTRILTDQSGQVTDSYHYDAYGNILAQTGITPNNYLYTGEQYDPNLGFYYLRARYMSPEIGRFISMDTYQGALDGPITLNKYLYGNADPVNHIDPSGNIGLIDISAANSVRTSLTTYATSGAGVTALTKSAVELAFEYATGIPVITSPKNLAKAIRSLKDSIGDLANKHFLKKFKAGNNFEKNVKDTWGLTKNTTCYKDGKPAKPPGCFIPDFMINKNGRAVEVKTSAGALKKVQFQEFMKISQQNGQPLSMVFLKPPTAADISKMQKWASEISPGNEDILIKLVHVLD